MEGEAVLKYFQHIKPIQQPTAIALGLFDGVHRGHQAVIRQAVEGNQGLMPVVLSFHTRHAIPANKSNFSMIITDRIKQDLLEKLGVRILIEPDFVEIRDLKAEQFIQLLADQLQLKVIACGYNYHFGKGGKGDVDLLRKLAEPYGIQVKSMPPLLDDGEPISSTRIRQAIAEGNIQQANCLLGYEYCFDFPVVTGAQLGRTIGLPTINQVFRSEFLIPKFGVYASYLYIGHKKYYGVTNVGVKPTVHNTSFPLAETHIIGFEGDLYGKNIKVHLLEYLRPEQKFSGIPELKAAIQENVNQIQQRYAKKS